MLYRLIQTTLAHIDPHVAHEPFKHGHGFKVTGAFMGWLLCRSPGGLSHEGVGLGRGQRVHYKQSTWRHVKLRGHPIPFITQTGQSVRNRSE